MPSVSKSQQRLFGMAYACKKGELEDCPPEIQKLANSMSLDSLRKFAVTKHKNLPNRVRTKSGKPDLRVKQNRKKVESIVFSVENKKEIFEFINWLNEKEFLHKYNVKNNEIFIPNNLLLDENEENEFCNFIINLGMKEKYIYLSEDFTTLVNTVGMDAINPPNNFDNKSNINIGSGDRFDNSIENDNDNDNDNDEYEKKKKRKIPEHQILTFKEYFLNKINKEK